MPLEVMGLMLGEFTDEVGRHCTPTGRPPCDTTSLTGRPQLSAFLSQCHLSPLPFTTACRHTYQSERTPMQYMVRVTDVFAMPQSGTGPLCPPSGHGFSRDLLRPPAPPAHSAALSQRHSSAALPVALF